MVAPIGASETAWADFCFISEQPGHPRKRPRELQQSKARAHAATVVWKRKMSKKQRSSSAARTDPVETRSARYPFSDYACSTGLRVDGFYCLPFTQDQQDLEILDWHRQTILSKQTIQWDILSISAWAPNAEASLAESTMFSHASLAVASLKFERRSIINANPSNTTLRHSNLAVSMLRDQLKQNELVIDPALLCTMVYLAIFEIQLGNLTAAKVHRGGIRSTLLLPSAMAQLEAENRWKSIVLQYDLISAMYSGEKPSSLHRDNRRSGPWSPSEASHLRRLVHHLPEGYRDLIEQSDLSQHTTEMLCRTVFTHCPSQQELKDSLDYLAKARSSDNDFWETCPYLMTNPELVNMDKIMLLTIMVRKSLPQDGSTVVMTPVLLSATSAELSRRILLYRPLSEVERKAAIWALVSALEAWHVEDPTWNCGPPRALIAGFRKFYPAMMNVEVLLDLVSQFSWQAPSPRLTAVCEAVSRHG